MTVIAKSEQLMDEHLDAISEDAFMELYDKVETHQGVLISSFLEQQSHTIRVCEGMVTHQI